MKIEPRQGVRVETNWTRRINGKLFLFHVQKFQNGRIRVTIDQWQDGMNCYRTRKILTF